jgi:two-component system CitB family sensor kinase
VWVRDSGPGVAAEDREAVFTAGWSTKAPGGRGVGLSLVRQLVERRGGQVAVEDAGEADDSSGDRAAPRTGGALFTVWLPDALRARAPVGGPAHDHPAPTDPWTA